MPINHNILPRADQPALLGVVSACLFDSPVIFPDPMLRPEIPIDEDQVRELADLHCPDSARVVS